jgi:serine/threonine protein kinase
MDGAFIDPQTRKTYNRFGKCQFTMTSRQVSETAEWVKPVTPTSDADDGTQPPKLQFAQQPLRTLGRFTLIRQIGRGGFGTVYLADDPENRRKVAIKVLHAHVADEEALRRFAREAKAAITLRHRNIVATYECECEGRIHYLVSEFVEGMALAEVIRRCRVPPQKAAEWVRKIAIALSCAHDHRLIHRDVKPANIMVTKKGEIKLLDFGLARWLNQTSSLTSTGDVMGTPAYMSPEQARGDRNIGPLSDQYSLGVVFYELLTRQVPFAGPPHEVIAKLLSVDAVPEAPAFAEVPQELKGICLRMTAIDPKQRYASAWEVVTQIDAFFAGKPLARRRRGWRSAVNWLWRQNRMLLISGASIVSTAIVMTVVVALASLDFVTIARASGIALFVMLSVIVSLALAFRGLLIDHYLGGDESLGRWSDWGDSWWD